MARGRRLALTLMVALGLGSGAGRGESVDRIALDGDSWRIHETLPGRWNSMRYRHLREPGASLRGWLPDLNRPEAWYRATVPGAVIADLVAAGQVADPFVGLQSRAAEWASQRDWIFSRKFDVPESWRGSRVRLRFEGIDPGGVVLVNGFELATHRGMFVPLELEVTERLRFGAANDLDVIVFHAPDHQPRIQTENEQTPWKARFATGWDFAPRLVPVGLWDSVELKRSGSCLLGSVSARAFLDGDRGRVAYGAQLSCATPGATVEAVLRRNQVEVVRSTHGVSQAAVALDESLSIARPEPWFPNGSGAQTLYDFELSVRDPQGVVSDREVVRVGFRAIEWVRAEGAGPRDLPYGAVVNGHPIFLKGWNWVPADQLYGRVDRARYEDLLIKMQASNANLVRVWGGGLVEKEAFYDLADRLGLMVWQESPLTSFGGRENLPGATPEYLSSISAELQTIVSRRRHHPALAIWSGGNELVDDAWRPLGADHPYSKATRELLGALAPDLLVLPSSPSGEVYFAKPEEKGRMGDVHGPWRYLGPEKQSEFYDGIDPMLHSEFGIASLTNPGSLASIGSAVDLWPPRAGSSVWAHHNGAWYDRVQTEALFGPITDLQSAVRFSQFLHAEGLRYAVEAHRRRFPRTVGCLPWQFNEPWPAVAGTFSVDFSGEPKPSYWWVRRAYSARSLAASYPRIAWRPGQEFGAELWVINESEEITGGRLWYRLDDAEGRSLGEADRPLASLAPSSKALPVATIRLALPLDEDRILLLRAELRDRDGRVLAEHRSIHVVSAGGDLKPLRAIGPTKVDSTRLGDGRLEIRNVGPRIALGVQLRTGGDIPTDNYRFLAPGENWQVRIDDAGRAPIEFDWWNR